MTNLSDPNTFERIDKAVGDIVTFDKVANAKELLDGLSSLLLTTRNLELEKPDYFDFYSTALEKARWIALPFLSEEEIKNLFKNSFMLMFEEEDFDYWNKLTQKLITLPRDFDKDALKSIVIEGLRLNNQTLTTKKIKRREQELPGTVGNWIKDYDFEVGTGPKESIELTQYLVGSTNAKGLAKEDREKLRRVLLFYEKMKLPSGSEKGMVGFEADFDVVEPYVIIDGEKSRVDDDKLTSELLSVADVIEEAGVYPGFVHPRQELWQYLPEEEKPAAPPSPKSVPARAVTLLSDEEKKQIFQLERQLSTQTKGDVNQLGDELLNTLNVSLGKKIDRIKILSLLRLLIKSQKFDQLIDRHKGISREVENSLKDREDIQMFKVSRRDSRFIKRFVRHVLVDRTGLSENDAARFGAHLSAVARQINWQKAAKLGYFDVKSKQFKWF